MTRTENYATREAKQEFKKQCTSIVNKFRNKSHPIDNALIQIFHKTPSLCLHETVTYYAVFIQCIKNHFKKFDLKFSYVDMVEETTDYSQKVVIKGFIERMN